MANVENFTGKIVGVVVGIIVVAAVAIPVIQGLMADPDGSGPLKPTVDPNSTAGTILGIIPVFFILAVLMIVVRMFMGRQNDN